MTDTVPKFWPQSTGVAPPRASPHFLNQSASRAISPMDTQDTDQYLCVGICMVDPDSGYCLGCGRPPLGEPEVVSEAVKPSTSAENARAGFADSPE